MNYRTVVTGVDDGVPNTVDKFKCRHCGRWVEEIEEDGNDYICMDCIGEFAHCSRCGKWEVIDDMTGSLCYECDKDDLLQAAMADYKKLTEENVRTNWAIQDVAHKHAGIIYSTLYSEVERRKAKILKEKK